MKRENGNGKKVDNLMSRNIELCKEDTTCKLKSCSNFARIIIALAIALLTMGSAYAVVDLMGVQGTAYNNGIAINNGNITVTIWNAPTGGALIYNSSADFNGKVNNGTFDISLGSGSQTLVLQYGVTYYMDMEINGQNLDFNGNERNAFQSSVGNITSPYIETNAVTTSQISDSTIADIDISGTASIAKSKISTSGTWQESDIPSLTNSWAGYINATKILSAQLLNVNDSLHLSGYTATQFLENDTSLNSGINSLNTTKAGIATCPSGQVVMNTTSSGVQCVPLPIANGNTSQEIRNAINNSGTYNISVNASNILLAPWLVSYTETDSIFASHYGDFYNVSNPKQYINSSYGNTTYILASHYPDFGNYSAERTAVYTNISTLQGAGYLTSVPVAYYNNISSLQGAGYLTSVPVAYYNNISSLQGAGYITVSALTPYLQKSDVVAAVGNYSLERSTLYTNISTLQGAGYITASALTPYMQKSDVVAAVGNYSLERSTIYGNMTSINSTSLKNMTCSGSQVLQNATTSGAQCIDPTVSAGGIDRSIQFNNGGTIDGNNKNTITSEGNINLGNQSFIPATPTTGITLAAKQRAGETVFMTIGPSGIDKVYQPLMGEEFAIWCQAAGTATGTTAPLCQGTALVASVGTLSNPVKTVGSVRGAMSWAVATSSAASYDEFKPTSTGLAYVRGNSSLPIDLQNGGFKLMATYYFGGQTAVTGAGIGVTSLTSGTAMTNASNWYIGAGGNNDIFVGYYQAGTNLSYFISNATSGEQKVYDCGSDYSTTNTLSVFRTTIFARPNGGNVSFYTVRVDNSSVAPCEFIVNGNDPRLPLGQVPLGWRWWSGGVNATSPAGVVMAMNKVYVSTDN